MKTTKVTEMGYCGVDAFIYEIKEDEQNPENVGKFFFDEDGDFYDASMKGFGQCHIDCLDMLVAKYNGTYYPSAQESHNNQLDRIYGGY